MAKAQKADRGEFELDESQANQEALDKAKKLAQEAMTLEHRIERLEDQSAFLQQRYNHIKSHDIPEALRKAGINQFTALDGRSVSVEDFISGSLPKEEPARSKAI